MQHPRIMPAAIAALALSSLCLIRTAGADDWLQYRKDPFRSGASRDAVALPLTNIWEFPNAGTPVVWQGHVYTVRLVGESRTLLCLDGRTGAVLWQHALRKPPVYLAWSYDPEPSVSEDGTVFVYDFAGDRFLIRSFEGRLGRPLAVIGGETIRENVLLNDGGAGQAQATDREIGRLTGLGLPLLLGGELLACGFGDTVSRCAPGGAARELSLRHQIGPGLVTARLERNPPLFLQSGVLVTGFWNLSAPLSGSPAVPDFVAFTDGGNQVRWHRELPSTPGAAAAGKDAIFLSMLGGVICLDTTGNLRWTYAPRGLGAPAHHDVTIHPNRELVRAQLVVADDQVYLPSGVALNQRTGEVVWRSEDPARTGAAAIAASSRHLFTWGGGRLSALRLADGKLEWADPLPGWGELVVSQGLLLAAPHQYSGPLRMFAPAERTFRLAVDSSETGAYQHPPDPDGAAAAVAPQEPGAAEGAKTRPAMADGSILRLRWGDPPAELVRSARARRDLTPRLPLTLVLDWLDSTRSHPGPTELKGGWTTEAVERFTRVCSDLAAEAHPEYLDIAPDLNVYLLRQPGQAARVRELYGAVRRAVAEASPETKVLVSFNAEVLSGRYGKGSYLPFGPVELPLPGMMPSWRELLPDLDAVGLTCYPQAGFQHAEELPADYLLSLQPTWQGKPLLITSMGVRCAAASGEAALEQAAFLQRSMRACYWLNARMVAYPDAAIDSNGRKEPAPQLALAEKAGPRPALQVWNEVLAWKRVQHLSSPLEALTRPQAPSSLPAAAGEDAGMNSPR